MQHAALHGIDCDQRVYVLFLDPLTPFIVPLQSMTIKFIVEQISQF
jgi:hypothetical protein